VSASAQEIRFCTAPDGARIAYATVGKGLPLVRAAHWLTHLEFDWQGPVWRPWLTALSRDNTLIRYDARGCGLSDWDVADVSLDAWIADLETVVAAAGLARFALLGASQSASVAIAYAVKHPERISHLILYGGFARGRLKRGSPEQVEEAETELRLIRLGWGRENPAFRQAFTTGFIPDGTPEQLRWFNELQRVSTSPGHAARIVQAASTIDVSDLLPRIAVPTLVLHSRDDARVPFDEGRRLASAIPNARFVPLEGRNHILLESEPAWPRFLAEIRGFLSTGGPAAGLTAGALPELTAREKEVIELLARGLANDEIAARLGISPKTVRNQVSALFQKLGVSSRAQAIVKAREAGLGTGSPRGG
jgi:pimeloyl-ACP methyl ester carboxylesterase/DNA-binding CsgD family transcriptional regulator